MWLEVDGKQQATRRTYIFSASTAFLATSSPRHSVSTLPSCIFSSAPTLPICGFAVSGAELTGTHGGLVAFGVVSRVRVPACTSSEDGGLAGFESEWGHEEDKLEARCSRNNGCHSESWASVNHQGQRLMDNDVKTSGPPNLD
jgi:hypothetical protein